MVKINAQVEQKTRDAIRYLASEGKTTVQAITRVTIELGLDALASMSQSRRTKLVPPDRRRKSENS